MKTPNSQNISFLNSKYVFELMLPPLVPKVDKYHDGVLIFKAAAFMRFIMRYQIFFRYFFLTIT